MWCMASLHFGYTSLLLGRGYRGWCTAARVKPSAIYPARSWTSHAPRCAHTRDVVGYIGIRWHAQRACTDVPVLFLTISMRAVQWCVARVQQMPVRMVMRMCSYRLFVTLTYCIGDELDIFMFRGTHAHALTHAHTHASRIHAPHFAGGPSTDVSHVSRTLYCEEPAWGALVA